MGYPHFTNKAERKIRRYFFFVHKNLTPKEPFVHNALIHTVLLVIKVFLGLVEKGEVE